MSIYVLYAEWYLFPLSQRGKETMTLYIETKEGVDVLSACRAAAQEFATTDEGLAAYAENGNSINWDVFDRLVPNEICEKHGIRKLGYRYADSKHDMRENLVTPPRVFVDNIEWDSRETLEENWFWPDFCSIPVCALTPDPELGYTRKGYEQAAIKHIENNIGKGHRILKYDIRMET